MDTTGRRSQNVISAPPVDPMALLMFELIQQERAQSGGRPRAATAPPISFEPPGTAVKDFQQDAGSAVRSLAPKGTPPMNQAPGSLPPGAPLLQAPAGAAGMAPAPSQQNLLAILAALSGKPMGGSPMLPGGQSPMAPPMPGGPMMGGR